MIFFMFITTFILKKMSHYIQWNAFHKRRDDINIFSWTASLLRAHGLLITTIISYKRWINSTQTKTERQTNNIRHVHKYSKIINNSISSLIASSQTCETRQDKYRNPKQQRYFLRKTIAAIDASFDNNINAD